MIRVGSKYDGGYLLCQNFLSKAKALVNFGIEENDIFGCELSEMMNVTNYQYDCTVKNAPISQNSCKNLFEKFCIG